MSVPTLAIDCDLHKIYAVDNTGAVVAKAAPDASPIISWIAEHPDGVVLMEIAGAKDYTADDKRIAYHKRRWTIFNAAVAGFIFAAHRYLLVSPSSRWTKRHSLDVRHKAAGCVQTQKDLRECEAMLWFHTHHPEDWVSMPEFLRDL